VDPRDDHPSTPPLVERAQVIPIDGWYLPPPPDWRLTDEAKHLRQLRDGVLTPEDLTLNGRPRCFTRNRAGVRCGNEALPGSTVCRFHTRGTQVHSETGIEVDEMGSTRSVAVARQARIDAVRTHLELTAQAAVMAVESILEDEAARPQDRLKAAEIVLDRTVGRTLQLEREDAQERDLDKEILAIAETLDATGTDGE
jgi:hypothetical protein